MRFTLSGAYQFADTFDVVSADPAIVAQAGRIAGAFHFRFEDGREARTHVSGATANRVVDGAGEIFGTMRINVFEAEAEPRDSELLFLAYTGDVRVENGSRVTVAVRGAFIGGTGRHAGATGSLELTSINGVFTDGRGELVLAQRGSGGQAAEA